MPFSPGPDDIDTKLPEYQRRCDQEIRRVHPYDRTATVLRRQDDGTHDEAVSRGGAIECFALPGVTILHARFDG